jgi:hypothetical protein
MAQFIKMATADELADQQAKLVEGRFWGRPPGRPLKPTP